MFWKNGNTGTVKVVQRTTCKRQSVQNVISKIMVLGIRCAEHSVLFHGVIILLLRSVDVE